MIVINTTSNDIVTMYMEINGERQIKLTLCLCNALVMKAHINVICEKTLMIKCAPTTYGKMPSKPSYVLGWGQ